MKSVDYTFVSMYDIIKTVHSFQTDVNECASNPCQNSLSCTNLINDYRCTCKTGYTGKQCEINIGMYALWCFLQ